MRSCVLRGGCAADASGDRSGAWHGGGGGEDPRRGHGARRKCSRPLTTLANVIGPRLTNSPAHKRAVAWTQDTLQDVWAGERPRRAMGVRPRLDAREILGRDDRAALHAADRLSARAGPPRRAARSPPRRCGCRTRTAAAAESPGRQAEGRHRPDQPAAGLPHSRGPAAGRGRPGERPAANQPAMPPAELPAAPQGRRRRRHARAQHRRARHLLRHRPRRRAPTRSPPSSWPPSTTT